MRVYNIPTGIIRYRGIIKGNEIEVINHKEIPPYCWYTKGIYKTKGRATDAASKIKNSLKKLPAGINIYTDGSYSNTNKIGSWAFVVANGQNLLYEAAGILTSPPTDLTSQSAICEVTAGIKALEWVKTSGFTSITVYSDCNLVTETATGYYKAKQSYTKEFKALVDEHPEVEWKHVKGHSGNPGNDHADMLSADIIYNSLKEK